MKAAPEIVIVGPGRLGKTMARWLKSSGRQVTLVGRGEDIPSAPLTWLTVPDRSIQEASEAVPKGGVLLHASGALGLDPLEPHPLRGSLHPLMTFTGSESRSEMVPTIPAAVSGRGEAQSVALALALELGFEPFSFSGDRRAYHAAAVLSGNFGTVLLARAAEILATQGIPIAQARRILAPLTIQSIRNAAAMPPEAVLTGPVARGDQDVIQSHIQAIQEHAPENVDLYITLLQSATSLLDHREANSD